MTVATIRTTTPTTIAMSGRSDDRPKFSFGAVWWEADQITAPRIPRNRLMANDNNVARPESGESGRGLGLGGLA